MAQARFIEHNGQRIDITSKDVSYETRCDGCGEYVTQSATARATIALHIGGHPVRQEFVEGHAEHVAEAIDKMIDQARREYFL